VCPLDVGRLGQRQVQLFLEVPVHHVNHAVAEPQRRNSELTRLNVTTMFLPSGIAKRLFFSDGVLMIP